MGQFHDEIPEYLFDWLLKQQMFWVASAPLSPDGHVNISPKAIEGTFHVENSRRVWYEDLSGSGAETVAHIRENGRMSILFHAFEGPARLIRLYGKGYFHEIGSPEYEALLPSDKRIPGSRAIIGLDVHKVCTTCGYAVPYYQFIGHRSQLIDWAARKEVVDYEDTTSPSTVPLSLQQPTSDPLSPPTRAESSSRIAQPSPPTPWAERLNPKGMIHWWQSHNLKSIDGLPAFSATLGKGFPFNFTLRFRSVASARTQPPPHRPTPKRRSSKSSGRVYAPVHSTARNAMEQSPSSNTLSASMDMLSGIDSKGDRFGLKFRLDVLASSISLIFPFALTLVFGILIGRIYQKYIYLTHGLVLP